MARKVMGVYVPPINPPYELAHIVCGCEYGVHHGMEWDPNSRLMVCVHCRKIPKYFLRTCQKCTKAYVMLFTHPFACERETGWCLDCLNSLSEPRCNHDRCNKVVKKIPEFLLTKREKVDLSKVDLPDIEW